MSIYEQNLQALLKVNVKIATLLFGLKTNEKFEVFVDEKDPLNINIAHSKTGKVLYENVPIRQTEEYLDTFIKEYQRYPYLYFFGLGNGVFYKALLQNETHKRVVVVEPELEILYMALHFNDFSKELESGRLVILMANDINFSLASEIFMHPESRLFSKTYQFHILLPFYEKEYGTYIVAINRVFLQAIEHAVRGLGNDSTDALIGLQHQIANIERMVHTPTTLELIQKIKNSEVAVIVSTGPSLKKQLPLLKKIKEHTTLFCIDASLPILEKEGIKPDIVISIERIIETAKFYQETSKEFQEDIIYVITSIAHPDLFKEIKAGTLQISMRPFGYTSYFEMPEYGYLGIGMSAANMAYELVFHANFKTCILIGQDLAYGADGSTHSDGHIYGNKEKDKNKQRYRVTAYGGEGSVETSVIWKLFKNFFESDIAYANAKGIDTINATEGGARIEGSKEMPFAEAIEKYVDFNHKKELVHLKKPDVNTIEKNLKKIDAKIEHMLSYAIKIQKEVETTFLHVARECERIENVKENERYEKLDYQALADVMGEIDHIKGFFDDQEFANIFTDATQAMILHQEIELAKIQVRNVVADNEKRQKMIDWVLAHQYWLFSLAGMMQATIDAINMGIEMKVDFNSIKVIRIYVNDKEIDVLHIDHTDALINNIFDLKQICINYKLDEKYTDEINRLQFYYSDEIESFKVEVHIPSRSDRLFSKFMFLNSLEATLDRKYFTKGIQDNKDKLSVGLLPVEDIFENKKFIEFIQQLLNKFPEVCLKLICWTEEEKELSKSIFANELGSIEFIAPKDIYELYDELDMFVYDLEKLEDKRFYAIRHILNSTQKVDLPQLKIDQENDEESTLKEHINAISLTISSRYLQNMHIDVYIGDEKIDEIHKGDKAVNNIFDLKQLCIEYIPCEKYALKSNELRFIYIDEDRDIMVSLDMPSRDDENYKEFAFKNALQTTIDKERLEHLYEKDAIGFLAVEENLKNEDFMNYIKELMIRFPNVTFKMFGFNEFDHELACKFNIQIEKNPLEFLNNIKVYIHNAEATKWESLSYEILKYHKDLCTLWYTKILNEKKVGDYILPKNDFYLNSLITLGVPSENLEMNNFKYEIILNKYLTNLCNRSDIVINDEVSMNDLKHFYYVELALTCPIFRAKLFQLRKLHFNF